VKPNPIALLIDDDKATRRMLRLLLASHHYRFFEATSGKLGLVTSKACQPDVIILELALPDIAGLKVLKQLRQSSQTPVLVLSVCNTETDAVAALDEGANDFMAKPFGETELLARLRVLRRCIPGELDESMLISGDLTIDLTNHLVTLNSRRIDLSPTEEALLHALATYAGKVVTGKYLLRSVWGVEGADHLQYLRVFMFHLRKKLDGTEESIVIETVGSLGYRLLLRDGGSVREESEYSPETMELQNVELL
jgi:two-component system KDP operon response regulator KdpE